MESDAGILNLILSQREPQSELALLRGSRFIASATLLIAHVHISICLGSPIFGHPTLWEGLTHDYLWIACFLYESKIRITDYNKKAMKKFIHSNFFWKYSLSSLVLIVKLTNTLVSKT